MIREDGGPVSGVLADRPLIICFAGDVWDGNPHSRHHLMRRLKDDYDVLFIEGVAMRSVARDRHELRRAWRKLRTRAGLRTVEPGLHVLRSAPIPPAGPIGWRAQLALLLREISRARNRLALGGPVVAWFSLPTMAPLLGRLGEATSVFYYQDRYDAFSWVDAGLLRARVGELARGCDICICPGDELAGDLRAHGAQPHVVPHGVEIERFAGEPTRPRDVAALEPPLVGCVGLIDDHLSVDCLLAVADRLECGTLVLVGGANIDTRPFRHRRIVLLGRRPYESMPAYLASFSCCLVPFAVNRLTKGVNPIKLREYLAAGRPVVSTQLPEVVPYGDVVALANDPSEFAELVAKALEPENDSDAVRRRRRQRVSGETWDAAAARIDVLLRAQLART